MGVKTLTKTGLAMISSFSMGSQQGVQRGILGQTFPKDLFIPFICISTRTHIATIFRVKRL